MSAAIPTSYDAPEIGAQACLQAMTVDWLEQVLVVENGVYEHPWTHGNFKDSLNSGYQAQLITGGSGKSAELLGYFIAMQGVDEVHLLNIAVAPQHQGCGWSRLMLDALCLWARAQGAQWLWLEARVSNTHAKAIYQHYGFTQVGLRRNYYPEASGGAKGREDAVLMSFAL
jgi:ribosomal-protein-alanine N-acetyltransferase